jgi:hypothetical protein
MGFMNERVKQLAEQAGLTDYMVFGRIESKEDVLKNFAESIVRECGEIAYKTYWNNPLEVRGVHFKEAMYKRFGIKYE